MEFRLSSRVELPLVVVAFAWLGFPDCGVVVGRSTTCGLVAGGWLPGAVPGAVDGAPVTAGVPGKVVGTCVVSGIVGASCAAAEGAVVWTGRVMVVASFPTVGRGEPPPTPTPAMIRPQTTTPSGHQ